MHIRLLAVGDRQPAWVNDAFAAYAERLPREWKFRLDTIPTVRRSKNDKSRQAMEAEGTQVLARLRDAIQSGRYRIPARDVADAIISFFDRAEPEPPPPGPTAVEER